MLHVWVAAGFQEKSSMCLRKKKKPKGRFCWKYWIFSLHRKYFSLVLPRLQCLTLQLAKALVTFSLTGFVIRPGVPHCWNIDRRDPVELASLGCFCFEVICQRRRTSLVIKFKLCKLCRLLLFFQTPSRQLFKSETFCLNLLSEIPYLSSSIFSEGLVDHMATRVTGRRLAIKKKAAKFTE